MGGLRPQCQQATFATGLLIGTHRPVVEDNTHGAETGKWVLINAHWY